MIGALNTAALATAGASGESTLVSVRAVDGDGAPIPRAQVDVLAWPSEDELALMKEGDTFSNRIVATAHTNASGKASVIMSRTDVKKALAGAEKVGLDIVTSTRTGSLSTTYAMTLTTADHSAGISKSGEGAAVDSGPLVDRTTASISQPLSIVATLDAGIQTSRSARDVGGGAPSSEQSATVRPDSISQDDAGSSSPSPAATPADGPTFPDGCSIGSGTTLLERLGKQWVNVGNAIIRGTGMRTRFEYTTDASSELGVGISTGGASFPGISAQGTVKKGLNTTVRFNWIDTPRQAYLDTQFTYGKFCRVIRNPGPSKTFSVRAITHQGGGRFREGTDKITFPAKYCVFYAADTGAEQTTTRANRWEYGAKLSEAIGVNLSSQTGFTTQAKQVWDFMKDGRLCGRDDDPVGKPDILALLPAPK